MKRVYTIASGAKPSRTDVCRLQTRQLPNGDTRVYIRLFQQRGEHSTGHADFPSWSAARQWMDKQHDDFEALGWTERLPKRRR